MNNVEDIIFKLETELLKPEIRKDKEKINKLLSNDFFEFCSTGEIYNYKVDDTFYEENVYFKISNFNFKKLSDDCVLVTYMLLKKYGLNNNVKSSIRSSIWKYNNGDWEMVFHQGTPVVTK